MINSFDIVKTKVYDLCEFKIYKFKVEDESKEYQACQFKLNDLKIICRTAKITPKKVGLFVTFWKRNEQGITEPFSEKDEFDLFVINVCTENKSGQFVFSKSILIEKGIIATGKKDGKRGFRVYPIWDLANNKQAEKTQKWQLNYFYEIGKATDFIKVNKLYNIESY